MSIVDERPAQHASSSPPDLGHPAAQSGSTIGLTQLAGSSRPTFTITDAATACAVSRKTITRKLADLATHGASKDEDGIWRIPVEALLAVGLHPGRSLPRDGGTPAQAAAAPPLSVPALAVAPPASTPHPAPGADMVSVTRERWDDLRLRLARAEAEANERAAALADARLALRALTAAPTRSETPGHQALSLAEQLPRSAAHEPRKRRWWQAKQPG